MFILPMEHRVSAGVKHQETDSNEEVEARNMLSTKKEREAKIKPEAKAM